MCSAQTAAVKQRVYSAAVEIFSQYLTSTDTVNPPSEQKAALLQSYTSHWFEDIDLFYMVTISNPGFFFDVLF